MARDPKRARRARTVPAWTVPIVVVAAVLLAEVGARIVGPNIPRRSGSEERAYVKADQIYSRSGPTDLVILGSSESGAGLIPSTILREATSLHGGYNASLVGAPLDITQEWASRVVLPQLDPKVVVVGIFPTAVVDLSGIETDPTDRTLAAYRSAFDLIDPGGLGSWGWKLRQESALIRYRPYLRKPTDAWEGLRTTLSGGTDAPDPKGLTMDARTETDPAKVKALTASDGEILEYREPSPVGTSNAVAVAAFSQVSKLPLDLGPLGDLFDEIEASGAAPVLAIAPIDRAVLERDGARLDGVDGFEQQLTDWAKANDIPVFSEFSQAWQASWFNDRQHVSEAGAQQWSKELGTWLEQECTSGSLVDDCR